MCIYYAGYTYLYINKGNLTKQINFLKIHINMSKSCFGVQEVSTD